MSETEWTPDQPIVSIRDVHKSFGDLEVLKGVSLDVMKGEVICIIGPSGSGKSTLIRCINALNDIQAGSIQVEGQEVNAPEPEQAGTAQESRHGVPAVQPVPAQDGARKCHDGAVAGFETARKKKLKRRARALVKKVRLEGKENNYPGESCQAASNSVSPSPVRWP